MKIPFSMIILSCVLLSTGCSLDKTAPKIELLQKEVVASNSTYDPNESILSVKDDADGKLQYSKEKGEVKGKYTIEQKNASSYGYTAVVTATDKAGNSTIKKFSVVYLNKITDTMKDLTPDIAKVTDTMKDLMADASEGKQSTTPNSESNIVNHDVGSPEERDYETKKIQLTTPSSITASTDAKGWTIQWGAVDHADYYEISLDGSQPQRANTNSYVYDSSQIISVGNHTITIKAFSVNSTYTESEEGSGVVQYEPQLKTIPVMYIQGESTYVDSGNPTVDVYIGTEYTYQDLDNMAGGFATTATKTLRYPSGTVHIYDTTTSIQIYLNE